jgi:hypothetical protein
MEERGEAKERYKPLKGCGRKLKLAAVIKGKSGPGLKPVPAGKFTERADPEHAS